MRISNAIALGFVLLATVFGAACAPTVKIEAPEKPIQINMNVKIEQEVRVRVEKDLEQEFASNPALFGVPSAAKPAASKTGGK